LSRSTNVDFHTHFTAWDEVFAHFLSGLYLKRFFTGPPFTLLGILALITIHGYFIPL
jgi:hypothetical protein